MISIIIPVYNSSKYLKQCLESVINQKYIDLEIIIVNDGSTDDSLEICKKYSLNDKRIKIIDKENSGVSSSRNIGIENSSGDWITFLDADDWFELDCFSFCIDELNRFDIDLLCFNHYLNSESFESKMHSLPNCILRREKGELKSLALDMMYPYYDFIKNKIEVGSIRAVWGKFFKSKVIKTKKISFDTEVKIAEDALFCLKYIESINTVAFYNNYYLHYRIHNMSTMNKYQPNVHSINQIIMQTFYDKYKYEILNDKDYLICYTGNAIECLFRTLKLFILHEENKHSFKMKINEIKNLFQDEYFNLAFTCEASEFFPLGKRELLYFARKKNPYGVFFVGKISILALFLFSYTKKLIK